MGFDPTTAKPVRSGFDPSSAKPFTPAKIQPPEPVSGDVPGVFREAVDYLTEPPNKEDFSGMQTAVSGAGGAGIAAAAPALLERGGKFVSKIPLPYAKQIGGGAQVLGEALGKIPF